MWVSAFRQIRANDKAGDDAPALLENYRKRIS
jgi:hypothetical protein